jgi:hypothetical protein
VNTPVAFDLQPIRNPVHDSITVWTFVERGGRRYRAGQLRVPYRDYAAMARMLGQEPIAEDAVPVRQSAVDLAEEIVASAAEALHLPSRTQAAQSLVDDWNRDFKPGQRVRHWAMIDKEYDLDEDAGLEGVTDGQAFLLGGRAAVWITDWAMPVSLTHVQPVAKP